MRTRPFVAGVVVLLGLGAARAAGEPTLLEKVAAYCREHKGEQVGDGECAGLAEAALGAAGAQKRGPDDPGAGDYVWGKLVLRLERDKGKLTSSGKREEIKAGDVIQFRDVQFQWRQGNRTYTMSMPHHTAVVVGVADKGRTVRVLHQNHAGKKTVQESTLRLDDLKEGWLRVYEPEP
jgi:hypothetical protein